MARHVRRSVDRVTQRRRLLVGSCLGCSGLLALAALVVALKLKGATAPAPPPPEAQLPTAPEVAATPPQVPLSQQLQQVRAAANSGVSQPVQLDVRPDELAATISQEAQRRGVQDLRLYFGEGTVAAQAKVPYGGRLLDATVRVRPSIQDGQLRLDIQEARIGRTAVPAQLLAKWQEELDKALRNNPPQKTHLWLQTLQVEPGRIIVGGQTVP